MRPIPVICVLTFVQSGCASAVLDPRIPLVEDCIEIRIGTPSGWWLRIRQDGGGKFGYGSSVGDFEEFAGGTFKFEDEYRRLSSIVSDGGNVRDFHSVVFQPRTSNARPLAFYTQDENTIQKLFERAKLAMRPTSTKSIEHDWRKRLEKLWKKSPPGPI